MSHNLSCSVRRDHKSSIFIAHKPARTRIRSAALSMHAPLCATIKRSEIEGVVKKAKPNKSRSMAVNAECSVELSGPTQPEPNEEWIIRIGQLQDALTVCPNDILARSELATLLEQLGQPKQALCHWNMVLACDPNSLNGREGVARCRQRIG